MRIKGFFERRFDPPAPFVKAVVVSKALSMSGMVDFHIDTGASASMILYRDLRYLKLDVARLKRAERDVGGIGGQIKTYVIEDAALMFRTSEAAVVKEELELLVGSHDLKNLGAESRSLIMVIPSLLGRDVLRRFRLVCDERSDEVYLER